MDPVQILVITGSTRPVRIGDQLSAAVAQLADDLGPVVATVEDLAVRALPLLDEPQPPAMGDYTRQHSRDWLAAVTRADAVVFVTPEYNAGYPAPLKNAIDYLFAEWQDKPALVVSYGSRGGARVQKQLGEVASSLRMRTTTGVEVTLTRADYDPAGRLVDPERTLAPHRPALTEALEELVALARSAGQSAATLPVAA